MNQLETAMLWRWKGISTIPLLARDKRPALDSWKVYQNRLPTAGELSAWFSSGRYNIAVVTGWQNLTILDFDRMDAYFEWLEKSHMGLSVSETYKVKTSKGIHLYFYCTEKEGNFTAQEQGFDIRGAGGYAAIPPSIHPSGHVYSSIGSPDQIITITSIWDIIEKPEKPEVYPDCDYRNMDIFDIAMSDSAGVKIEDVKAKHTIYEVLGMATEKRKLQIKCPSPMHPDNHPSCTVYPDGHVYCFSCGFSGDLVDVYAAIHGVTLIQALKELA